MADPKVGSLDDIFGETPPSPDNLDEFADLVGVSRPPGEFARGVKRGGFITGANIARSGEGFATQLGADRGKQFFSQIAEGAEARASELGAAVPTPFDIESPGDAIDYAAGLFGEQAVRLPITALSAYFGSRVGAKLNPADKVLGSMMGGGAGAAVPSFLENFGDVYGEQREIGIDDPMTAAKYALPISALDAFSPGLFFGLLRDPVEGVTKRGIREGFKRILAGAGIGAASESPTEALQEYLAIRARGEVDPSFDIHSDESKRRVISGAAAGAVIGGGFGGVGGGVNAVLDPASGTGAVVPEVDPVQQVREEIKSEVPVPTAKDLTPEITQAGTELGLPTIDPDPLPLIETPVPDDEFTARLAKADSEFAENPEAFEAKALRNLIPEIEAELTLLEKESKSRAKGRRAASAIAADRSALQGQLEAVQNRASALERLSETPKYQSKTPLVQGTLLSVEQDPKGRVLGDPAAFDEQAGRIRKARGDLISSRQARAIKKSDESVAAAALPIVTVKDRARERIRSVSDKDKSEALRAQQADVVHSNVRDLVENGLIRSEVSTSVSTVISRAVDKARSITAPEDRDKAVRAGVRRALKGKGMSKEDVATVADRVISEVRQTVPAPEVDKPLRSIKPEFLAGIPEDAVQETLFDEEGAPLPAGVIQFEHFGNVPGGVTDPSKIGSGVRGADQRFADEAGLQYTSAIVAGSDFKELAVTRQPKFTGTLSEDKVYVARNADPLLAQVRQRVEQSGTFNESLVWMEYAKEVRDQGFDAMLYAGGQLRIFTPQKVSPAFNLPVAQNKATEISAKTKASGGGTWNLITGVELGGTPNYAVSPYKGRELVLPGNPTAEQIRDYIAANDDLFSNPSNVLGTWYNNEDGNTYLDVSVVTPSFKVAKALAKKHKQIAFFNLRTYDDIPTASPEPEQVTMFRNTQQFNQLDAEYHAKAVDAIAELESMLGTPANLKVKVFTGEGQSPAGIYQKGELKDVISLAENSSDITSVAAHEGFHFLEERVLPAGDRAVLTRGFAKGSRMFKQLQTAASKYDQINGTSVVDEINAIPAEARAYGYEFWKRGELQTSGAIERVFNFIKSLLERISNSLSGHGFTGAEDIFKMIERGKYAQRDVQALRVEDHTGNSWINDIEPDAIPGLHKAGAKTKSNTASSQAKGRPKWVTSGNAVAAMRRQLKSLALEGEAGRTWHEDSSREIMNFYDGDIVKAEILAKLIAVFSPRTKVGGDILFALQAIDQHNRGETIRAGVFPTAMSKKASEILNLNESENTVTGIKRNTFYRNLMLGIDPANFNSETQGATIDMWMAHAFGYDRSTAGNINLSEYRYAEAETGRLARELGWGIEETQAAIWVAAKTRWNLARSAVKEYAKKNNLIVSAPGTRGGVSAMREVIKTDPESVSKYLSHWRKLAMAVNPKKEDYTDALFNYGDAIRTLRGAELLEPSDIRLPEIQDTELGMEEDVVALSPEIDADVGEVSLKYYSKASLADLITMAKRGEAQTTQMYSALGDLIDKANIPEDVQKQVFGNTIKGYTRGATSSFKTFYDEHISSGLNLARKSVGFKNVFDVITGYTQRKNRLIANSVDTQLSKWRTGSTSDNLANVTKALLERTVNGYGKDSPELEATLSKLSDIERQMFDQATNMIADRLRAELEADKISYAKLLGADTRQYAEWLAAREGHVDQLIEEGYFPERRYGDHGVHVYMEANGKRLTLAYELDSHRGTAEKRAEQLKDVLKDYPELKVEYAFKHKAEHDGSTSFQQFLDIARREGVSLTQAEKERVAKALVASDSVRRNRIFRRKNVPGFSEDGMRILAEFAVTMSNKIAYAEFGSAIQDALAGTVINVNFDSQGAPEVTPIPNTDTWSNDGELAGFYRNLADNTADFVLAPRPGNKASSLLRGAATFQFLGGSLAAGGIQLTSLAMNTTPYLTQYTSYTDSLAKTLAGLKIAVGNSAALTNIAKLQDETVKIPAVDSVPGLRQALTRAAQDGTNLDTEIYQIMGLTRGKILAQSRNVQRALNGWMAPFRLTEQWNRISTFISAYNVGRQNKLSGDELYTFAQKAVYDTQFRYDEANRPAIARGPWGAMLFTFKTYPIFMLELMTALGKESPKAAVIMALSLTAMAGVEGLPFVEDLEDLIDTISQRVFGSTFNSKRALRNVFKDASEAMTGVDLSGWFMHGVANQITGLNFANRVGLGNLLPGSRMGAADADYKNVMSEILGPAGAVAQGYLSGLDALSRGEINKAAKLALPLGVRNVIKGVEQWNSGFAQDIGGRNIVPVSGWEAFWQSLGFSSSALSSAYDVDRIDRATSAYYKEAKRQITNDIVKAVRRGDNRAVDDAVEAIKAWNQSNPSMPMVINGPNIRRTIALAGLPLNQRNLLLLPRALRGSSESMIELYGTDR